MNRFEPVPAASAELHRAMIRGAKGIVSLCFKPSLQAALAKQSSKQEAVNFSLAPSVKHDQAKQRHTKKFQKLESLSDFPNLNIFEQR